MKTAIKRVLEAVEDGNYAEASSKLNLAQAAIDKNVKRNIIHKNNAARKKSRLTLKVKALEGATPVADTPVDAVDVAAPPTVDQPPPAAPVAEADTD